MRDIHSSTKVTRRAERRRVRDRGRGWAPSALALGSLFLMLATVGGAATPAQSAEFIPPSGAPTTLEELKQLFPAKCKGVELAYAGGGGLVGEANDKAFLGPYSEMFDVSFVHDIYDASGLAKLKAMVDAGQVTWDLFIGTTPPEAAALGLDYLEEIDWGLVNGVDMLPGTALPYFVPQEVWTTNLVINTKTYPDPAKGPRSWVDFWDVEKFPGRRTLSGDMWSFYAPLYGLGWRADEIYPMTREKAEKAFEQLRKIKPHINVWTATWVQPGQLVVDDQADMVLSWNGRAQPLVDEGMSLRIVWEAQHFGGSSGLSIPKGTPNLECAMHVAAYAALPEVQAARAEILPYGPANVKGGPLVSEEVRAKLPTAPGTVDNFYSMDRDLEFWEEYQDWVAEEMVRLLVE
jgi:putative spermidine/putrescine transport system substrate-binding protein